MSSSPDWSRQHCPSCGARAAFFCVRCYVPVGAPPGVQVPLLRLPVKVDLIFKDNPSKSSAIHAKVLAPDDVALVPYGDAPGPGCDPRDTNEDALENA